MIDIPGYDVSGALTTSGPYTYFRARRTVDAAPVLIKAAQGGPRAAAEGLEREFVLLRPIGIPGAPRPLQLIEAGGAPCLVLEDRGLAPLAARPREAAGHVAASLAIASRICEVLASLHRQDIVCGAVDPHTVLSSADGREVMLLDFSLAARLPQAGTTPLLAHAPAAYLSPEQTGRIGRAVDHRSDLYCLGVTLYELLTGVPPFRSADRLEVIHAHIARLPAAPAAIAADVPVQVSRIVMRLLAKAAEERYQSARGVQHDVERCLADLAEGTTIRTFDLGARDVSDRFVIPQKLYGRERELGELMAAFDETCAGRTGLLLVSGYSGIGKTSLIGELHAPIARRRGYLVSGKFDQVVRNIPYGALLQACRRLLWQILAESEDRLAAWREELLAALAGNGAVLAEVLPEVELIIGRQEPPPPLDAAEAQNRFRYVFQNFVGVLARQDHPLVIFLDDLQWVDAATLDALQALVTAPELRHLLVIGAYRSNEVDEGHLLTWGIRRLEQSGAPLRHLSLGPLAQDDVLGFLGDTLHAPADTLQPLAELISQKTDGNPFFVIQFLRALHQEGLFQFDDDRSGWTFGVDRIAASGMTDNVIDLMTARIRRLSPLAQHAVRIAACIGSPFDARAFKAASGLSPENASEALVEICEAGLIHETAGRDTQAGSARASSYAFLHDRVQQSAYELIPPVERPGVHLGLGRLLRAASGEPLPDHRLFPVVEHFNIGAALIEGCAERLEVARLNLAAGRKARLSAAYRAAAEYLEQGLRLAAAQGWRSEYDLLFALHLEAAECQYLAGDFDVAERHFDLLLSHAATALDRAQVHSLRTVLYENQSRYADAVASGLSGLALFDVSFPESHPQLDATLEQEIQAIQVLLADRPIAALGELPRMEDPQRLMVMRILTSLWAPTYLSGNDRLTRLISATMVRLSLEHGNSGYSAYGYVTHAITIGPVRRDYAAAYEWGELALVVNERFGDTKHRAKIQQQFHAHVKLWRRPFESCLPHAREARRSGLESGDFTYAGYATVSESWPAMVICRSLDRFVREYSPGLALLARIRMTDFAAALRVMLNWAAALQGRTAGPLSLSDEEFDESAFLAKYRTDAPFFLTFLYTARLHLCLLHGEFETAAEMAAQARDVAVPGTIWPVLIDAWGSLACAQLVETASAEQQRDYLRRIEAAHASLSDLARHSPENFYAFALLVGSERRRLEGDGDAALRLCEEAIAWARTYGQLQQEALASEMCARLWLQRGSEQVAASFLADARLACVAWGATAKVRQLEQRYGAMAAADADPHGTPAEPSTALDLASVLKIAGAISMAIEREELLRRLMLIALENAGAERGFFLQERDGTLMIEAEAGTDGTPVRVRQGIPWADAPNLAHAVVRYVRRTGQDVVLANARTDERFADDAYIARAGAKSILCVPIGQQGRASGVLYLENNLTTGAFTPQRLELMRIVAAQAAISLENARLYDDMRSEVERRTQAEHSLRQALAELQALKTRLETENVYLQEEIRTEHNFNEIVGNSLALVAALRKVELVASTESTVLVLGETGSGKELFARAIHSRSPRAARPLVKVNCGAITPGLVESELFGHVKGAFTGAIDKRLGRFEVANGGTILLDEIGELPMEAQVKLLRVLQEQEFEPVGSSRTVRVNVRVIAATNRDLERAVREATFRADLLYRLNVFPIVVPPLRERRSDIPLLVALSVTGASRRLGKQLQGFSARSMERMVAYPWPGNVRELQNVVERAAILAQGPILEVEPAFGQTPGFDAPAARVTETLDSVQRAHIITVLNATGGVIEGVRGAASALGLHPNTLRSRIKKLGISPRQTS
jgi:predicted ATPase/transcriptional regulator with GAF, ATPase, and Fis domain